MHPKRYIVVEVIEQRRDFPVGFVPNEVNNELCR